MQDKLTITGKKACRKLKDTSALARDEWSVHCVKSIFLDIWRVQWCVCFWSLWFSKPTISFRVVSGQVFFRICMLQSPVSCLWSMLPVF